MASFPEPLQSHMLTLPLVPEGADVFVGAVDRNDGPMIAEPQRRTNVGAH